LEQHLRTAALLNLIFCIAGVLAALYVIAYGGPVAEVARARRIAEVPPMVLIASFFLVHTAAMAIPALLTAIGLFKLRPWVRTVGVVSAVMCAVGIPFGTILGAYVLWVLMSPEVEPLFPRTL
jgi:hypothetical protein